MLGLPAHQPFEGETWEQAVARTMAELRAVLEPPYDDLIRQAKHYKGECVTCDAERALVKVYD